MTWQSVTEAASALGSLGGSQSEAYAVNDVGQIVGWSLTSSGIPRGFLWQDGTMIELATCDPG